METEFVTYKRFSVLNTAEEFVELLKKNNIPFEFENNNPYEDISATYGAVTQEEYIVRIQNSDFTRVDELLVKDAEETIPLLDKDYYLYAFTNEELYDVIENFDNWTTLDFILAKRILKERGENINDEVVKEKKDHRIKDLAEPESAMSGWMIVGLISALLGGILGMFIGYHHWKFKKRLPSGEKVLAYDEKSRNLGKKIFYLGLLFYILWCLTYIFVI